MQKDVIYIDVEDDITAIIGKVKGAKEKVVALVPPKRIGVLQSAVNLRLLARTADSANKRLVLITNNTALSGLAASAKIPVAKNLQSKPEIAPIPVLKVDDDDVIEGAELPVGDHADSVNTETPAAEAVPSSTIESLDIDGDAATPVKPAAPARKPGAKKSIKVPDFGSFRKKIFIFGGLGVLLIAFLVWAIWFAPHATVVINAKTSDQELSMPVTIGTSVTTDSDQGHLQSIEQQDKDTQTIDFDATGTKDVGEKATGTVKFSTSSFGGLGTIPAGTALQTAGGLTFITNSSVTLAYTGGTSASGTTTVTAAEQGTKYNGATGSLSGAPSSVSANLVDATAGGTEKIIKIVLQADVEKAKAQLAAQNKDVMRKKLQDKFDKDVVVINESFQVKGGDPQSSPAIGQEASSGKAKLTQETTYVLVGVAKAQLNSFLDSAVKKLLTSADEQKVYDNGASAVKFADFKQGDGEQAATANLSTTAQVGPKIEINEIKEQVKGKRYGEIEGDLRAIEGVNGVDVKLSPFWVQGVPGDVNKITVEFKIQKNNG